MATIRVKNPNLGGEKWITIPTKILSEADHIVTNKGQGDLYLSNDGTYKDVIKSANDYTDKLIELIVGSSPDILETLKELSNQTSNNKDFINILNKSIATKLDKTANAVSASKLATPIKLWGNDFDGSLSVYGILCASNGNLGLAINTNNVVLGNTTNPSYVYGSNIMFKTGTDAVAAYISSDGKVGIGTANPLQGFHVSSNSLFDGDVIIGNNTNDDPLQIHGTNIGFYYNNESYYFGHSPTYGWSISSNGGANRYSILHAGNYDLYLTNSNVAGSKTLLLSVRRPTDANCLEGKGDGGLRLFKASNNMTQNKPPVDGTILHCSWDNNGGFDSQLCIANGGYDASDIINEYLYWRGLSAGTWGPWKTIAFTDSNNLANYYTKSEIDTGYFKDMRVGLADDLGGMEEKVESEYIIQPTASTNEIRDGYAHIDSLKGNSIVWNQCVNATNASAQFDPSLYTISLQPNGIVKVIKSEGGTTTLDNIFVRFKHDFIANHKYLIKFNLKRNDRLNSVHQILSSGVYDGLKYHPLKYTNIIDGAFLNPSENFTSIQIQICLYVSSETIALDYTIAPKIYDLTKMFGSGNEPETLEEFYARIPQDIDLYAHNEGEIINLTADSIKSVGFNQWDEEWENGTYDGETGDKRDSIMHIRSKNLIKVLPNTMYRIFGEQHDNNDQPFRLRFYRKDRSYIGYAGLATLNTGFTTPPDCYYIGLVVYGTTYNNDVCINLYNLDKNGTYEPYKEFVRQLPTNLFEGGMKSIGTVCDEIYWDKDKKKYIKVARIGSVDWDRVSIFYNSDFSRFLLTAINKKSGYSNIKASIYNYNQSPLNANASTDKSIAGYDRDPHIYINDFDYTDAEAYRAAMKERGIKIYYELAEPIIEELDIPYMDYEVSNDGTETIESTTPTTPIKASVTYNFDAVNTIKLNRFDISDIKKGAIKLSELIKQSSDGTNYLEKISFIRSNKANGYIMGDIRDVLGLNKEGFVLYTYGYGSINFYTLNQQRLCITADGNVGIGITNPQYKLDVVGNIRATNGMVLNNNASLITLDSKGNNVNAVGMTPDNTLLIGKGALLNNYSLSLNGNKLYFNTGSDTTSMVINEHGNVGIGTINPKSKFVISTISTELNPSMGDLAKSYTICFKAGGYYGTYFWTNSSGVGNIQVGREDDNPTAYDLKLQPLDGRVSIGQIIPEYRLSVEGTMHSTNGVVVNNGAHISSKDTNNNALSILTLNSDNKLIIGDGTSTSGYSTFIDGKSIVLRTNICKNSAVFVNVHENVTIGNSDLARTNCKLYVAGYSHIEHGVVTNNNNAYNILDNTGAVCNLISLNSDNLLVFGYGSATKGYTTYIDGGKLEFRYGTNHSTGMVINNKGFVTIGNYDYTGTNHLLYVNGSGYFKSGIYIPNNTGIYMYDNSGTSVNVAHINSDDLMVFGYGSAIKGYGSAIYGKKIFFSYGESPKVGMTINELGNVTIGEYDLAGTNNKLYVDGNTGLNGHVSCKNLSAHNGESTFAYSNYSDPAPGKNAAIKISGSVYQANGEVSFNGQITSGELVDWYGVSWSENSSDPTCTRIGNMALHRSLPILSAMKGYWINNSQAEIPEMLLPLEDDWKNVLYAHDHNRSLQIQEYWSGNAMVKIPEFWYIDEYESSTKTHNLKISQTAKAGWCHHKEAYVGAYEGYGDGARYRSVKDKIPTVSMTREQYRTLARANGYEDEYKWNIYTYEEHRAICHLFLVEYATRNSQAPVNTALTADGFKQGGLGSGCTTGTMDGAYSFIPTGTTDSLGNGSGQVAYTASNGTTYYANRYRGIENPFGHIWKHVDDIVNVYNSSNGIKTVYKCNKPEHFATNKNTEYKPLCSFPGGSKMQGWSKEIKATINCDFFKYSVGGSESTYWCDYNYDNDDTSEHCLLIGSCSGHGGRAGLFYFHLSYGVGDSYVALGSRLTYLPWAE